MRKDGPGLSLKLMLGSNFCEVLLAQTMMIDDDDDVQYNIYRTRNSPTDQNTSYCTA